MPKPNLLFMNSCLFVDSRSLLNPFLVTSQHLTSGSHLHFCFLHVTHWILFWIWLWLSELTVTTPACYLDQCIKSTPTLFRHQTSFINILPGPVKELSSDLKGWWYFFHFKFTKNFQPSTHTLLFSRVRQPEVPVIQPLPVCQ